MDHGEAVASRQHHVQDHRVVAGLAEESFDRPVTIALDVDRVAVGFEIEPKTVGEVDFVFDNEDPGHRGKGEG